MQNCKILALVVSLGLLFAPQISVAQTLEALEQQASSAEDVKNYEEAANIWRSLIASDRNNSYAYVKLAGVLSKQGKVAEAITAYRQALQLTPEAEIYIKFADFLAEKGRITEAIAAYRQAIKLDPKTSMYYYSLGSKLMESGNAEQAILVYRQMLKLEPNADNYNILADALLKAGKREEAIAAYREALKKDPKSYLAYYYLGEILEYKEAVSIYRQASKNDPQNEVYYQRLAKLSLDRGFIDEAIAAYRQLTQIEPSASNYAELGDVLLTQKQHSQAITAYRQAVAVDSSDYYYKKLNEALIQDDNLDEALANCQKVVEIGEGSYETCSTISLPLHKEKGLAGVKAFYQQFANQIPRRKLSELYTELGRNIAYGDGSKQEAIAAIRQALQVDPNNSDAQSAIKSLISY